MQAVGLVRTLFEIYSVIMLIRVLSSWFQVDPYSPVMRLLYQVTEPVLAPRPYPTPCVGGPPGAGARSIACRKPEGWTSAQWWL